MLKLKEKIEIRLETLANGGDAIGHHLGQTVFVPYGVPGDRVRAVTFDDRRTYARASILEILEPSPLRVKAPCQYFGDCGSCQWQMMEYRTQLDHKKNIVAEVLRKVGKIEPPEISLINGKQHFNYRNKAQYPVSAENRSMRIGYYRQASHKLVPIDNCLILKEQLNKTYTHVRNVIQKSGIIPYDENNHKGSLRHLVLRCNGIGEAGLTIVTSGDGIEQQVTEELLTFPALRSVWVNINARKGNTILGDKWKHLGGEDYLVDRIGTVRYRLSPGSFWQVNQEVAEAAYRQLALGLGLQGKEVLVDLYCGVGAMTLQLAGLCENVIGIEISKKAVEDAGINAELNGIGNAVFMAGSAGDMLAQIDKTQVLVADPPRSGLEMSVIGHIERLKPDKIGYLSCDSATLARDISRLVPIGYRIKQIWLADMFPQTYHVETLVILERGR
jgi:23S rRNA (uracil1939-C5)-methyltransferase